MKKISLLLVIFSANLFAHSNEVVKMTYFGNEGRNRIMLSCYYVEGSVENILRDLDAVDVDVRCSGGIQYNTYSPVRVSAKFDLSEVEQTIKIKSEMGSNCYFDTAFIKELINSSDRIEKVSGSTHCFRPNSNYSITLKIK